jgi:hypothetical protein
MTVIFERGSSERPRGHALLYFRSRSDPQEVWVTYVVILPVNVDVSKYVPPFLMNQMGELSSKELSAFAFPPAPERLGSYEALEQMAASREDDILFAGTLNPTDLPSAMMSISEATQQYAEMYSRYAGTAEAGTRMDEMEGAGVSDVLYGLMSESDRLTELTKLVGRLRFAVDGSDESLISETEEEISLLASHLPDNLDIPKLVRAAKSSDSRSAKLAELYLQRCYHLSLEEYAKLGQVEARIREMESREPPRRQ